MIELFLQQPYGLFYGCVAMGGVCSIAGGATTGGACSIAGGATGGATGATKGGV